MDDGKSARRTEIVASMSEEEIHAHPEFAGIRRAVNDLADMVADVPVNDAVEIARRIGRTVDPQVAAHVGTHRLADVMPSLGMPAETLAMLFKPLVSVWLDGFLIGQRYQITQDAELATITAPDTIKDL